MKLIHKLYLSFGLVITLAVASVVMAVWSAREAAYHLDRTHFAHQQYEGYLALSNHTYKLFKQLGDRLLIGDLDRGAGETQLIAVIREDIRALRHLTGSEIRLVGYREVEELDRLAKIERVLEALVAEYMLFVDGNDLAAIRNDWARLSDMLDARIDRDFSAIIQEAIEAEGEEVREVRDETAARITLFKVAAAVFAFIALVAGALSLAMLARDIRRPIGQLLAGTRAFAAGEMEHRIAAGGSSELDDVGRSFNTMADQISAREAALAQAKARLEQAVEERTAELKRVLDQLRVHEENRRRLLADVSHELRTPLTIIQGEADIALRGREKTPDVYREALEKSREAAKHTARLVDDLLFVARREAGEARLRCEAVDLARLLPEVIDDHRALAGGRGGGIAFTSAVETATVRADGDRIRQVVVILMDNALRYGDGRIEVALHGAPGGFAVSVTDVGPGMTEEEQERAFERFFRGSDAAHRYREGSGLGLPVAKAIVEAHGGQIALRSSPDQGTRVTFTVPVRPKLEAVA
ncbi:MAG TPA: HAMP domain-containing sensor histidine kinase [Rhodospirillales bacterium]|nr:HAMP domain-containing sensor histidine kinase [Rhodospirillales bacterium]